MICGKPSTDTDGASTVSGNAVVDRELDEMRLRIEQLERHIQDLRFLMGIGESPKP